MRSFIFAATAAAALASSGCASVAGVQDVEVDFQVIPKTDVGSPGTELEFAL